MAVKHNPPCTIKTYSAPREYNKQEWNTRAIEIAEVGIIGETS